MNIKICRKPSGKSDRKRKRIEQGAAANYIDGICAVFDSPHTRLVPHGVNQFYLQPHVNLPEEKDHLLKSYVFRGEMIPCKGGPILNAVETFVVLFNKLQPRKQP